VPDVKIRHGAIVLLTQGVGDKCRSVHAAGLQARGIVNRLRERVVEIPRQRLKALSNAKRRGVVVRARDRAVGRERTVLTLEKETLDVGIENIL
jgi:hypothetical protein